MSITVQNIMDDSSRHLAKRLKVGSAGEDATRLEGFVNQIYKDVLHTSVWETVNATSATFTSTPGGSPYTLSPADIRRITLVYDVKNSRILIPYQNLNVPAGTADPPERVGPPLEKHSQQQQLNGQYPQFYYFENGTTPKMHLLSDPDTLAYGGTIRYCYEKVVADVSAATILSIPEDGRDILVAGTNMMAFAYLGMAPEAAFWQGVYEGMKAGLRR